MSTVEGRVVAVAAGARAITTGPFAHAERALDEHRASGAGYRYRRSAAPPSSSETARHRARCCPSTPGRRRQDEEHPLHLPVAQRPAGAGSRVEFGRPNIHRQIGSDRADRDPRYRRAAEHRRAHQRGAALWPGAALVPPPVGPITARRHCGRTCRGSAVSSWGSRGRHRRRHPGRLPPAPGATATSQCSSASGGLTPPHDGEGHAARRRTRVPTGNRPPFLSRRDRPSSHPAATGGRAPTHSCTRRDHTVPRPSLPEPLACGGAGP